MSTEHESRLDALERHGLGKSLTGKQITVFTLTCFALPIIIGVLGRGLL